jgi:hypothetical protein
LRDPNHEVLVRDLGHRLTVLVRQSACEGELVNTGLADGAKSGRALERWCSGFAVHDWSA